MAGHVRLHVNIDHVATVRQARRGYEPSLGAAASLCEIAGADGITVHLRADRRHIQDDDVRLLRALVTTHLNVECATTDEMIDRMLELRPDTVTLVPEQPDEITTEGGLDVVAHRERAAEAVRRLKEDGLDVSIFVEPDPEQIRASAEIGADQIELCTARYAVLTEAPRGKGADRATQAAEVAREIARHAEASRLAAESGLRVAAGHGLTYLNVGPIAAIPEMEELNIGHNIVARAVLVGLDRAVREMLAAIGRQTSDASAD
jgi:pyridoxine 5-phosphate synthase